MKRCELCETTFNDPREFQDHKKWCNELLDEMLYEEQVFDITFFDGPEYK